MLKYFWKLNNDFNLMKMTHESAFEYVLSIVTSILPLKVLNQALHTNQFKQKSI